MTLKALVFRSLRTRQSGNNHNHGLQKKNVDCKQTVLQHISNGELMNMIPDVASSW